MNVRKLREMVPLPVEKVNWARYKEILGVSTITEKTESGTKVLEKTIGAIGVDIRDPLERRLMREIQRAVRTNPLYAEAIRKHSLELVTYVVAADILGAIAEGLGAKDPATPELRSIRISEVPELVNISFIRPLVSEMLNESRANALALCEMPPQSKKSLNKS
ncbi:MAG TPA: hypothetical protein VLD37_05550 [Candidatus Bilamarchaeum sp.]|nr:hypothetical protein [Candidatus Bilamarchaeum sp.]